MNTEFEKFVTLAGGRSAAAEVMGCKPTLVSMIRTGERDVSKDAAKKIITRFPEVSLYALLYPQDTAA